MHTKRVDSRLEKTKKWRKGTQHQQRKQIGRISAVKIRTRDRTNGIRKTDRMAMGLQC